MKKLLLSAFAFVLSASAAFAQEVVETITPSATPTLKNMTAIGGYSLNLTLTDPSGEHSYNVYGFNNNNNKWNPNPMRCGNKKATNGYTATISTKFMITAAVSKVEFDVYTVKLGTNDKVTSIKLLVSENSDFSNAVEYPADMTAFPTASGKAGKVTINVTAPAASKYYRIAFDLPQATNSGWLAVNTINFYGELAPDAVAAPTISCSTDNMVTITAADADAIYYTVNGDTPTTSSTKYEAPFAITENTTVKAIAVKGDKTSAVNTFDAVYIPTYANFAEFVAAGVKSGKVNGPIRPYYQNGQNLYVYDADNGGMLVYGASGTFTNGEAFSFIEGEYDTYYAEIKSPVFGEKSTTDAIVPENQNLDEISASMRYQYVQLTDVTIENLSERNFNYTDGTVTLPGFNKFNSTITVEEGAGYNVEGIVDLYKGNPQVIPVKIVKSSAIEGIDADNANAPVEYYNLQGIRVNNPENGIFIRRQGTDVKKVYVK